MPPYSLSVWLDDETAEMLDKMRIMEDRKRSAMVKVLIRRAARSPEYAEKLRQFDIAVKLEKETK